MFLHFLKETIIYHKIHIEHGHGSFCIFNLPLLYDFGLLWETQSTQIKPTQTRKEHTNSQKAPPLPGT